MADVNRTVSIIFQSEDRASNVAGAVAKNIEGLGTGANAASAKVDQLGNGLDGLEKTVPGISSVSTALQTLAASLIFKAFIDANVELEKFTKSMVATTGSSADAAKAYDYVREVANRFGIEVGATADSFAKFAAATKGTTLEGEGARNVFEAFAGTMSRLGSSSADINGAFVQLAQGISKGKFELEDLKSIAERVPGFFDAFARSLDKTTPELFKLISAGGIGATEISKFADALNKGLNGAEFDGYINSMARLKNEITQTFLILGNSGAFDALIKGVQLGTAAVVGSVSAFTLLGEIVGAFFAKLSLGSKFDFGASVEASINKAAEATRGASAALLGAEKATKAVGDAGTDSGTKLSEGLGKGTLSTEALKKALGEVDKSLRALGIDPSLFVDPVKDLGAAFKDLATNAAASGEQIVTGLIGALQKLPQDASLEEFRRQVAFAFRDGKINAEEYAQALALIDAKQSGLSPSFGPVTDAVRKQGEEFEKQAKAAEKAKDKADEYRLKMEELASNERIKNIEATVTLKVAQLEADTKRVIAAFESINNTVNSTENAISDLFGLFKNDGLSFQQLNLIRDQIDKENKRRDDALKLQGELTRAQIENIKAQTGLIDRGDALIKIDGAGLQPHLEGFMWEILKAVQVRVNANGLSMLLGV